MQTKTEPKYKGLEKESSGRSTNLGIYQRSALETQLDSLRRYVTVHLPYGYLLVGRMWQERL
jgi:hypothetical protein